MQSITFFCDTNCRQMQIYLGQGFTTIKVRCISKGVLRTLTCTFLSSTEQNEFFMLLSNWF